MLDNNNWFTFFKQHYKRIRTSIFENVTKVLACRTALLGFSYFKCADCYKQKKIPHSCKSRFCTSCGKAATDNWINKALATLPAVAYQHISFTMPDEYWPLFRVNRHLLGMLPKLAAHIVIDICTKGKKRKHYLPGIFLAIHTYGRDLKFNPHIHLSTTVGGFSLSHPDKYITGTIIDHQIIKNMWKYQITTLLRNAFKEGKLLPYPGVEHHFLNLTTFNKWLDSHWQKTWNVHLAKTQPDPKQAVQYLGKYLKKPPLAETKITTYDGQTVTFTFLDHYTKTYQEKTLPVMDFIAALITHIPDKYFRMIRYFGFLASRVRTRYMKLLNIDQLPEQSSYIPYVKRFLKAFGKNPLKCDCGCSALMKFCGLTFALPLNELINRHMRRALQPAGP